MAFMSKLKNTLGNEKIGELKGKEPEKKSLFKKKKSTPVKDEEVTSKELSVKDVAAFAEGGSEEEDVSKYITTEKVGGRSRGMIINKLKINDIHVIPENYVTETQIENVAFSVSVPSGLDTNEVESFCNTMEQAVKNYRELVLSLINDKDKLLGEIEQMEQNIIEDRHQAEIGAFLDNSNTEKEELREELIKAQSVKQRLETELKNLKKKTTVSLPPADNSVQDELKRRIKELEEENKREKEEKERLAQEKAQLKKEIESSTDVDLDSIAEAKAEKERIAKEVEEAKELKRKTLAEVSELKGSTVPKIDTPEEYEEYVLKNILNGANKPKHVKPKLTTEDLKRMASDDDDIVIDGF